MVERQGPDWEAIADRQSRVYLVRVRDQRSGRAADEYVRALNGLHAVLVAARRHTGMHESFEDLWQEVKVTPILNSNPAAGTRLIETDEERQARIEYAKTAAMEAVPV